MTNKYAILALVLLLAGLALIASPGGVCPVSAEGSPCLGGSGDGENCTGTHCALNNSSQSNCSTTGSCPVKKAGS